MLYQSLQACKTILPQLKTCKMKTKILAVATYTAVSLSLISCDWLFAKKHKPANSFSLSGKWVIENIADSSLSHKNDIGILALAMSTSDSTPLTAEFMTDSIFVFHKDTLKYYLDSTMQILLVKEDPSSISFSIKMRTDSSMQLYAQEDSFWVSLKRK